MTRQTHLRAEFVELIPELLEPGVLYVSQRYATAAHLCCCGCEREVVTPLNPAKWQLTERNGTVSLFPSIGNWSYPCQSHYFITNGQVRWASAMSPTLIAAVKQRDQRDAEIYAQEITGLKGTRQGAGTIWANLMRLIHKLLRL